MALRRREIAGERRIAAKKLRHWGGMGVLQAALGADHGRSDGSPPNLDARSLLPGTFPRDYSLHGHAAERALNTSRSAWS
jgi:hypothetical protein